MKKIILVIFFLLNFSYLLFAQESNSLTLSQCYKLALKQSELIAVDHEKIKQAEAHFQQAFGTLMPQVSFSRTQTWQDSDNSPSYNKSFEQKFVFKQALFTGFKEFAEIARSKLEKKQFESDKLRAQHILFTDVSDSFYLLFEMREDLKILEIIKKTFNDRLDELKNRVNLGKSRESEIVSVETQIYSLDDEIESVKSQETIAKELLEFLTGQKIQDILDNSEIINLKTENEYLEKSANRPDVLAADFAWQVEKKNVAVAKSKFFPTVNLEWNYFAHRNSTPKDSRWQTLLTFDLPIFEGITTFGQVKEANSKAKETELLFQRTNRIARQEIHDAYINIQSAYSRVSILEKALKSAEHNYELQENDYKLGIVNNLEVLTAISNLEDIRRKFNHILYESKRWYWQLQVAAGELSLD